MLDAEVLAENHQMVKVFRDSGFPVKTHTVPGYLLIEFPTSLSPEALRDMVHVASDPARHREWIEELLSLGFDEIQLSHVGQDVEGFIRVFGEHVLPYVEKAPAGQRDLA